MRSETLEAIMNDIIEKQREHDLKEAAIKAHQSTLDQGKKCGHCLRTRSDGAVILFKQTYCRDCAQAYGRIYRQVCLGKLPRTALLDWRLENVE